MKFFEWLIMHNRDSASWIRSIVFHFLNIVSEFDGPSFRCQFQFVSLLILILVLWIRPIYLKSPFIFTLNPSPLPIVRTFEWAECFLRVMYFLLLESTCIHTSAI
uniref:Uncharacterized protein n=1 Tax=Cacopsylla melanoneura TaxID=428564 RepID=A0A8D8X1L8_9HEMI